MTQTLDANLIQRIASRHQLLVREIDELAAELHTIAARTLALAARSVDPTATVVTVHDVDTSSTFAAVTCTGDAGTPVSVPGLTVEILGLVTAALRHLPAWGESAPWQRDGRSVHVNVDAALAEEPGFPFLPVQDRIHAALEEQTGKTIRTIEIVSEEFDNGYFPSTTVSVDYADGDSDDVHFAPFEDSDYFDALFEQTGPFGRNTTVTIRQRAGEITIA